MNTIKVIYITNPSKEEAEKIACHLLERKLIACANFYPIDSVYLWQGSLARDHEYALIVKTTEQNYEKVKKEVEAIHSYVTPCIIGTSCHVNDNYYTFILDSVS